MTAANYIDRLAKRLRRSLPASVVSNRVREIEVHLQAAMADGVSEQDALKHLGAIEVVGSEIVRQYRGYTDRSVWKLCWWLAPLLCACVVLPFVRLNYFLYHPNIPIDVDVWFAWSAKVAIVAYGFHVLRTRRWLVIPVTASVILGMLVVTFMTWWCFPPPPSAKDAARSLAFIKENLDRVRTKESALQQWRAGLPPKGQGPVVNEEQNNEVISLVPFTIPSASPNFVGLEQMPEVQAAIAWKLHGQELSNWVAIERSNAEEQLRQAREHRLPRRADLVTYLKSISSGILKTLLLTTAYFALLNATFLGIANLGSRYRNSRHRRLA